MKKAAGGLLVLLALYLALASQNIGGAGAGANTPTLSSAGGGHSVLGTPSISSAFINRVLHAAGSPAAGLGQSLYALGVHYGIDPVFALAFFHHESSYGTTGEAKVTMSLGNERCIPDRPCIDRARGGYALMRSWVDGFAHWYYLISTLYIGQWRRSTVESIIPKYAPGGDGNNEQAYINAVLSDVANYQAGQVVY